MAASPAWAHDGGMASAWSLDPWVVGPLALLGLLAPRRPVYFAGAVAALLLALVWPLEVLAGASLAAHMAQHMLLIAVAAPLLVLAAPRVRRIVPGRLCGTRGWRELARAAMVLARPRTAFVLHALAVWVGHAPPVIEWTIEFRWVHILEHAFLLGTALAFWFALVRTSASRGAAALWSLATLIHTGALGALITFAPRVLYPGYTLEDQQIAGLIMWIPGGMCYLAAGLLFMAAYLAREGRAARAAWEAAGK